MKTTSLFTFIFAFMLTGTISTLQAQSEISVDPFDGISVVGNIDVTLEEGTPGKITLYTEGIDEDDISIKVTRGTLRLRVLNSWLYKNEIIRVYVPYETIRSIRADAGATVECENTLQTEQMEVSIGSGASARLTIKVESLKGSASEGGRLVLRGETITQDVSAGTGGEFLAFDLECQRTYVRAGTGGIAEVVAHELLEAAANTGGQVTYKGDPEEKKIKTFIAGDVDRY